MMQESYEEFSQEQMKILEQFVSNTDSNVFALRNLPEVIKGALFSRYSRSRLGLRSLLLKEFIHNEETGFDSIVAYSPKDLEVSEQLLAIQKAQNFYDRILDGYGDDSIGELGGAHLALESVSMVATKLIEDCRIGGSPLEKSTRYIYFDQKVAGEYQFYREPILMTSAYRQLYIDTCNMLFETYSKLIPPLTAIMEEKIPKKEDSSKAAYAAAIRAKVLDCLRGLLPAGTLTNMGIYGNGRFFDGLIRKMRMHNLAELQDLGKKSYQELAKVIPSFIRRADPSHRHYQIEANYKDILEGQLKGIASKQKIEADSVKKLGVRLVDYDPQSVEKVVAALLFAWGKHDLEELRSHCDELSQEQISTILEAACAGRENRRHKSPRALEHAVFTFEIVADYGMYRDLQRHRMLTQERQLLTCDYGYYSPVDLEGTSMMQDYHEAMLKAKQAFDTIADELPEEAQYVVPMAYNIRWYFQINLRALQWMCELRSSPAGHPSYRYVVQEMAKKVFDVFPAFERFFKFVDFEGYELGRLQQEERQQGRKVERQS